MPARNLLRGDRELLDTVRAVFYHSRLSLAVGGHPAVCVVRREYRAVYLYAELRQRLECPRFPLADGETRGTEAPHTLPRYVLQHLYGAVNVLPELLRCLLPYELVVHRMRAYLVALGDATHHIRVRPGYPADDEECGAGVGVLQYAEDTLHVLVDAHLIGLPLLLGARGGVVEEMEPLLDIECQDIHL